MPEAPVMRAVACSMSKIPPNMRSAWLTKDSSLKALYQVMILV